MVPINTRNSVSYDIRVRHSGSSLKILFLTADLTLRLVIPVNHTT